MTIEEMKRQIETKNVADSLLIFICTDNNHFIAYQYVNAIAAQKHMTVNVIESLDVTDNLGDNLFDDEPTDILDVYYVENFNSTDAALNQRNNLIIITDKDTLKNKDTISLFDKSIVQILKLEEFQIKDYMYSLCDGVDGKKLDALQNLCVNDIYRIDNEISKIKIFEKTQRDELFTEFAQTNVFGTSSGNIFDLTNAIVKRDVSQIAVALLKLNLGEDDIMLLLTNLQRNFRDLLTVTFNPNSSINDDRFVGATDAETKKLQKQFYPIKNLKTMYTLGQVITIYEFLTGIDKRIKSGEFPMTDSTIDYIILKILSV